MLAEMEHRESHGEVISVENRLVHQMDIGDNDVRYRRTKTAAIARRRLVLLNHQCIDVSSLLFLIITIRIDLPTTYTYMKSSKPPQCYIN